MDDNLNRMDDPRDPELEVYARGKYAEGAAFVALAMRHGEKPCLGGECDGDGACFRHQATAAVAFRVIRQRKARIEPLPFAKLWDFPAYTFRRDGTIERVVRSKRGHIGTVRPFPANRMGHLKVWLYDANDRRTASWVHRLICRAFHGAPPFEGAIVRHLNDEVADCRAENLAWGTHAGNAVDREIKKRLNTEDW
jgi:hypothetical protein